MKSGLPVVLIWGEDFVARKLLLDFKGESVYVVTKVGNKEEEAPDKNVEYVKNFEESSVRFDYMFDFENSELVWSRAESDEARLVVVRRTRKVEDTFDKLKNRIMDWRLVYGYDVYGRGMEKDENWVGRLVESAVFNKDLEFPQNNGFVRCIEVSDFVEVLKKVCFVPGISGERILVYGRKVSVDEICKTLVMKAKMTKRGVLIYDSEMTEVSDSLVRDYWQKISWDGGGNFSKKIDDCLKYFFETADRRLRNKKKEITSTIKEETRTFKVEVEENEDLGPVHPLGRFVKPDLSMATETMEVTEELGSKVEDVGVTTETTEIKRGLEKRFAEMEDAEKKAAEEEIEEEIVGRKIKVEPEMVWAPKIKTKIKIKKKKKVARSEEIKVGFDWDGLKTKTEDEIFSKPTGRVLEKTEKNRKFRINWPIVAMPAVFVLLVGIVTVVNFFVTIWQVANGVEKSRVLIDGKKTEELTVLAETNLRKIDSLKNQLPLVSLEGRLFSYKGFSEILRVLELIWKTETDMVAFFDDSARFGEAIFRDGEMDWDKAKKEIVEKLNYLESNLGMVEARTRGDWSFLPSRLRSFVNTQSRRAGELRQLVAKIRESIDVVYFLIGADGARRDFLVLMQNEAELRPSGGFVGSYGVLSVENGKLLKLDVGDIYDIDGQLKGHVEPPKPIKEILGEASWYLRDANWQADFGQSARDIEWFFKKETGRNIDGIISINLAAVKQVIEAVGEIWVADVSEKVTADNLYEQAQFHSEKGFFAGSRQKSMFLAKLTNQLVDEIKNASEYKQVAIVRAFLEGLDRNEIQIWAKGDKIRRNLADLGWDGSMYSGGCGVENCMADYLFVVEANLGVNKSNYFIRRTIDRLVDISNRAVSRVIKIHYENTARSTAWPGGDYKNYMRVYLPDDVNIAEVVVYDSNDLTNRKVIEGKEMEIRKVNNKTELAFLVTVPVTKKRTVEIRYSSQIDINLGSDFSYLSYIQKQSGYGETPVISLISFPEGWQPMQVEPVATVVNGKLLFNQPLIKDLKMGVVVGK